jgi:SpoVK/Ycf46/Vps4 family AAA+-type ATPase
MSEGTTEEVQQLRLGVESALARVRQMRAAAERSIRLAEAFAELDGMTGLRQVKDEIHRLVRRTKVDARRAAQGGAAAAAVSLHLVFTGNPGTGKTTVARKVGKIFEAAGLLKKGHLVETDREGLTGIYKGEEAKLTAEKVSAALDGVLFIDEAYSLSPKNAGGWLQHGDEVISTLLKRMEDNRDRLCVIVAGYTDEMRRFIGSNPGLKSRFTRTIEFPDYSADEMFEIFSDMTRVGQFTLDAAAEVRARQATQNLAQNAGQEFGNARDVRTLFERTLENQASRLERDHRADANLAELKAEDIPVGKS